MDKTFGELNGLFSSLYDEYQRKENDHLREKWEQIRGVINYIRKLYYLKMRLDSDTCQELVTMVADIIALENYAIHNIPRQMHYQESGQFFSSQPLRELSRTAWPPLGFYGYMRVIDIIEFVLSDVSFYYNLYRNELGDMDLKILKMKKDCDNVKNNLMLHLTLVTRLDGDVMALNPLVKKFEALLHNTPEKFMNPDVTFKDEQLAAAYEVLSNQKEECPLKTPSSPLNFSSDEIVAMMANEAALETVAMEAAAKNLENYIKQMEGDQEVNVKKECEEKEVIEVKDE